MSKDKGKSARSDPKGKAKGKPKGKEERGFSVAANPRAAASIRRAKGWTGLAFFVIAGALSLQASVPVATAGERALIAGIAGYLLAWACSVTIWRQVMIAQLRKAAEEARKRREESAASEPTITPRQ